MSFTPSVNGQVTAIRFYKGPGNGGTHTGSLWSSTGTLLATGTFDNETATGWQTLTLDVPVNVTAGTTVRGVVLRATGSLRVGHRATSPAPTPRDRSPSRRPGTGATCMAPVEASRPTPGTAATTGSESSSERRSDAVRRRTDVAQTAPPGLSPIGGIARAVVSLGARRPTAMDPAQGPGPCGPALGELRMTTTERLGVAVVGAGYWGPNLIRNFRECGGLGPSGGLRPGHRAGGGRPRRPQRRRRDRLAGRAARPRRHRRDRDRDAGAHSPADRPRGAARRQARPGREAAGRQRGRGSRDGRAGSRARADPDGRPHVLLHAGGPEDPRAGRARAHSARSSSSTPCASTSA